MGEHGSEKKGEFLLRSPLSVFLPFAFFLFSSPILHGDGEFRACKGHSVSSLHPSCFSWFSPHPSFSLPPFSPTCAHYLFRLLSAYYVRFDIVAYPIPSPPAFLASRPPPSITQKEEGQGRRQGSKRKDKRSGERIREGQENESHKETIRKQRKNVRGKDNQKEI